MKPMTASQPAASVSKALVSAYKWLGFLVLMAILVGLTSYIGLNVIYFFHTGWLAPAIVSPTDPRVLELSSRLAHETWMKQQVESNRADLEIKITRADRVVALEAAYQERFKKAIARDAAARNAKLAHLARLGERYDVTKDDIERASRAYADFSREQSEQLYSAKLIDQEGMVKRSHELAELAHSSLNLQQSEVELRTKVADLSREASSLGSLAKTPDALKNDQALGYEGLRIAHEYQESVLTAQSSADEKVAAERSLLALDKAVGKYDQLLKTLEQSALLRAASHRMNVAFVPYSNLSRVTAGSVVFGCRLQVLWCAEVGRVKEVLEGEVTVKHPLWGTELRGQLVELEIRSAEAMQLPVLHVDRAPLLL